MTTILHELLARSADRNPGSVAVIFGDKQLTYGELHEQCQAVANGLHGLGLRREARVALYLPKQIETVAGIFGTAMAGGVFVPVNPLLKPHQVAHILRDCNAYTLITSRARLNLLADDLQTCSDLKNIVLVDDIADPNVDTVSVIGWNELVNMPATTRHMHIIDADMASILYTSGSTGKPKGVVLSHKNMTAGAVSVAGYLQNVPEDRLMAALPLSFDYGFSQISTAFSRGASVVLLNYLVPNDVLRTIVKHKVTGLAGVPPLWMQLAELDWPIEACRSLRYITNTGGAMPTALVETLRNKVPSADVYLMYGLTEAFRSTYLPPDQVTIRPNSIGKAIPNAEILVCREDGSVCDDNEPGELVHRGALVSLGYWNDPERTAHRFRPAPGRPSGLPQPELAVWSGDQVTRDEEGYLFFVGRMDDMIKSSGYRISPSEVEEVVYQDKSVTECAAVGLPNPALGQSVVVAYCSDDDAAELEVRLMATCKEEMPNYMIPSVFVRQQSLPRNPNGKIDRKAVAEIVKECIETKGEQHGHS